MKRSASESNRNTCFNLEWLSHSSRLAWPRISMDVGMTLIQMLNFPSTEPNAKIITMHFVRSLTEMSIFLLVNLVQLELRSVSKSIQSV